jgi:hypothetical protein
MSSTKTTSLQHQLLCHFHHQKQQHKQQQHHPQQQETVFKDKSCQTEPTDGFDQTSLIG